MENKTDSGKAEQNLGGERAERAAEAADSDDVSNVGFTPGPWKAHFNVPLATIPGHIEPRTEVCCPTAPTAKTGNTRVSRLACA